MEALKKNPFQRKVLQFIKNGYGRRFTPRKVESDNRSIKMQSLKLRFWSSKPIPT